MAYNKSIYCIQWVLKKDKTKRRHLGPPLYKRTSITKDPFTKEDANALAETANNLFSHAVHSAVKYSPIYMST